MPCGPAEEEEEEEELVAGVETRSRQPWRRRRRVKEGIDGRNERSLSTCSGSSRRLFSCRRRQEGFLRACGQTKIKGNRAG